MSEAITYMGANNHYKHCQHCIHSCWSEGKAYINTIADNLYTTTKIVTAKSINQYMYYKEMYVTALKTSYYAARLENK